MCPLIPADSMAAAVELVCYFATAVTAVASYLLTLRV